MIEGKKYIQLFAIDKNSHTMAQNWIKFLKNEPGFRVPIQGTNTWIQLFNGNMGFTAGLPTVELDTGEFININDSDYLIHIHLTGENSALLPRVKKLAPKATTIVSIDYALKLWQLALGFHNLEVIKSAIDAADYIFVQEPEIARVLTEFLGRDIPCIPHPYNIEAVKPYRDNYDEPKECIIMTHPYDNEYYVAHLVLHDLPIKTHIINVLDKNVHKMTNGVLFNKVSFNMEFEDMLTNERRKDGGFLPTSFMSYDCYGLLVFGRWILDMAALNLVCLTSKLSFAGRILFPDVCTDWYDITKQRELAIRLIEDKDFYNMVSDKGVERIEQFGIPQTKGRMKAFLEGKEFFDYKNWNGEE